MLEFYELRSGKNRVNLYKNQVLDIVGEPHLEEGEIGGFLKKDISFIIRNAEGIDPSKLKKVKVTEPYNLDMVICEPFNPDKDKTLEDLESEVELNKIKRLIDINVEHDPLERISALEQKLQYLGELNSKVKELPFYDPNSLSLFEKRRAKLLDPKSNPENLINSAIEHYKIERDYLKYLDENLKFVFPDSEENAKEVYRDLVENIRKVDKDFATNVEEFLKNNKVLIYHGEIGTERVLWGIYKSEEYHLSEKETLKGIEYVFRPTSDTNHLSPSIKGQFLKTYIFDKELKVLNERGINRVAYFNSVKDPFLEQKGFKTYVTKHKISGKKAFVQIKELNPSSNNDRISWI